MFARELEMQEVIYALAIVVIAILASWLVHRLLRKLVRRLGSGLGSMLVEALRCPVFTGILLSGVYFAILFLPFQPSLGRGISRGLHAAFILLAAWGGVILLDSLYRWLKTEVAAKTRNPIDDWVVSILRVLTPLLAALIVILGILGLYDVEVGGARDWLIAHGSRIAIIVFLSLVALSVISRAITPAIRGFVFRGGTGQTEEENRKRVETLSNVMVTTAQVFIIVIAGFVILSELGIDIAPILAGAGVVGIAVGFGAQTLVKDILSGLFIIMENQYRVGDVVTVAGISGLVEQIDLRRTVLRDLDGIIHVVSNGDIRIASNFTKELSRVNLNISVGYKEDLDHVIAVINRVCAEIAADPVWEPLIMNTPQVLRVNNLGDSGIELKILGDTKPGKQWDVAGEIRKRIKKAFDEEGIEIPWPHTKVYFGNSLTLSGREQEGGGNVDKRGAE